MNKRYLTVLVFLLYCGISTAQSLKAYQKAAANAEARQDYSEALANYQVIINDAGKETSENYYKAAESARQMHVYSIAEEYYQLVLNSEQKADYPLTDFWMGDVKKRLGKYDEAIAHYEAYLAGSGASGGERSDWAYKQIDDSNWAKERIQTEDAINIKHLDQKVNSDYTELAPLQVGEDLYFSSLRENVVDNLCAKPLTRMYMAKGNEAGAPVDISYNLQDRHTGHTTFGSNGNRIYYTLCLDESDNITTAKCQIYYRDKDNNGNWGAPTALPEQINMTGYTATQPSIGVDSETGTEYLFFVSNRPGGEGGMDIWCAAKGGNGQFGKPFSIPEINTPQHDVTPYFDNTYQALYFSSEGYKNLGGLDIYRIEQTGNGGWGTVTHMGYPLNSSYDDTYYSINFEQGSAHFTSNRPGGYCGADSLCVCNDIYKLPAPTLKVKILTFNEITREPLLGTTASMTLPKFPDMTAQVNSLLDAHIYENFSANFLKGYFVEATKEGYSNGTASFETPAPIADAVIEIPVYLRPEVDLTVYTFDTEGDSLGGVTIKLIELLPTEKELSIEKEEYSSSYYYGIDFRTRYMVIGEKNGYTSDTVVVTTENIPVVPTNLIEKLVLCKGLDPLPNVVLYFDNDEPDPDCENITTEQTYSQSYQTYVGHYQNRTGYYKSSSIHTSEMDAFFRDEVESGYNNLESLARNILKYFDETKGEGEIKVTIQGYASLRSNPRYNKALTKRRISSIRNYFANWVDASTGKGLAPYEDRIFVTEAPKGDENACRDCYVKSAITDVQACRDRRVEIIDVSILKNPCDNSFVEKKTY